MKYKNKRSMSEYEWLEFRRTHGVGGSEAASACGLSRYKGRFELWADKLTPTPEERDDNPAMYWGRALEPIVRSEFAKQTRRKVQEIRRIWIADDHPMFVDLDGRVVSDGDGPGIFEAKTSAIASEWGETGSQDVPLEYNLQCQHAMAVSGYQYACLAVLIAGRDFRHYLLPRDEEAIGYMTALESDFWDMVQAELPPDIDFKDKRAIDIVKAQHPGTNGEMIDLPDTIMHWHKIRQEAEKAIKTNEAIVNEAKARILDSMGDAAKGFLPDGTSYSRRLVQVGESHRDPFEYIRLSFHKTKGRK